MPALDVKCSTLRLWRTDASRSGQHINPGESMIRFLVKQIQNGINHGGRTMDHFFGRQVVSGSIPGLSRWVAGLASSCAATRSLCSRIGSPDPPDSLDSLEESEPWR